MTMDEPRTSSLQGGNVRICCSWYSAQLPLLTSCPKGAAVKIFCEKASWSYQIWVEVCRAVAWCNISRDICVWTCSLSCLPNILSALLSVLGKDMWPSNAVISWFSEGVSCFSNKMQSLAFYTLCLLESSVIFIFVFYREQLLKLEKLMVVTDIFMKQKVGAE